MQSQMQCFSIVRMQSGEVKFSNIKKQSIHDVSEFGIRRKAYLLDDQQCREEEFVDKHFQLSKSEDYSIARIYDLYEEQVDLFPKRHGSSLINHQTQYNSFLAESGLLEVEYLKTLFITPRVNKQGYYKYFIKRHGEYYVSCIDDTIPVHKKTKNPLWGLSLKYPWQLVLMKIWLKQKGSWHKFCHCQPFELLDAFGFPAYKSFNFAKEIEFLKHEKVSSSDKQRHLRQVALNSKSVFLYAKSIDNEKIKKVGLPPNLVAFKIRLISSDGQENMYRVESSVPVSWTGKNSLVVRNNIQSSVLEHNLNLEKSFVMMENQILKYFTKFYVTPQISLELGNLKIQDTFAVDNGKDENFIEFDVPKGEDGLCTISIQMPPDSMNHQGYFPQIKCFLSKSNTEQQIKKSHLRDDIRTSEKDGNLYLSSDCDKWEFFQIDYHQGYHYRTVSFNRLVEGHYVLYTKAFFNQGKRFPYIIRFNSQLNITEPDFATLSGDEIKVIFDSTFYQVSKSYGIETSLKEHSFEESITLSNTFDELGFGCIVIQTMAKAVHEVAMRVFPEKLKMNGLDILDYYYEVQDGKGKEKNFILKSKKGVPQIVVMKRIDNSRNALNKPFPPQGSIEFFKITPNDQLKKSRTKSIKESNSKSHNKSQNRSRNQSKKK